MKSLNGSELASYVKERQAKAVRGLRQAHSISPKLAVILTIDNPVIDTYVSIKQRYGQDVLIEVDRHRVEQSRVPALIKNLNADDSIHGIIVQLPLADPVQTEEIVNLVSPHKDVDGLAVKTDFIPATPTAILWLLAGYGVELKGKKILLIGKGKLVGAPLYRMLQAGGHDVTIADRSTVDLKEQCLAADVIITATGSPSIIFSDMLKPGAVVVDAGVASEDGKTVGDVAPEVHERDDILLTPPKGGVGPLTVSALFENVITAARSNVN